MPGAAHFLDVEKYYTVTQSVIDKISDIMYSTIITDNNILEIGMGDSSIQLKIVIRNGTVVLLMGSLSRSRTMADATLAA